MYYTGLDTCVAVVRLVVGAIGLAVSGDCVSFLGMEGCAVDHYLVVVGPISKNNTTHHCTLSLR